MTWEAMAVRLALRFESRPSDILDSASVLVWEAWKFFGCSDVWFLLELVASWSNGHLFPTLLGPRNMVP